MTDKQIALAAWQANFEEWVAAESELRHLLPDIKQERLAEHLRQWWKATSDLLLAAVHLEVHFGLRPDPPPYELLTKLSVTSADIANGNIPVLVSGVVLAGRTKAWDAERRDIGKAVRYVEAANAGTITDRKHNATVRKAYGVSAPTVRQWCQQREYYLYRLPTFAEAPDRVVREMFEAGARYRVFGRGTEAIRLRASKRG